MSVKVSNITTKFNNANIFRKCIIIEIIILKMVATFTVDRTSGGGGGKAN